MGIITLQKFFIRASIGAVTRIVGAFRMAVQNAGGT